MKQILLLIITFVYLCVFNLPLKTQNNQQYNNYEPIDEIGEVVKIISVSSNEALEVFDQESKIQTIKIKVLTGELKGQEFITENVLSNNPAYDISVTEGDRVILNIEKLEEGKYEVNIADKYRFNALIILFSLFVILILIFGGIKGLKALISLGITYILIFYLLVPSILKGMSPLILTIIICLLATCATIFIISGLNRKSLSAVLGTGGGVIAAGIIAYLTIKLAPLSGLPNHEAIGLWTANKELNFKGILASGMIIGALGASMDVAISIASSIFEVKQANPTSNTADLFRSGMNVGKDIMGTMTNTLLLAYTGSAIFLLLLVSGEVSILKLLNLDSIISEITAALAGSIGLVLCIPATALIASYLLNKEQPTGEKQ